VNLRIPRNHGDAVWAFVSSLGGGLVDGDDVSLRVDVGAGAKALLTTQASTKVYRSPSGCRQRLTATVGDGGLLVLLPDPVACFAGARLDQTIDVALGDGATLIMLDAVTCGRAASGERWELAAYRSVVTVTRAGAVIARDAIELDAAHAAIEPRMGRFEALATLIAIGPRGDVLGVPEAPARGAPTLAARSPLTVPDGALVRVAAETVEQLHGAVRGLLAGLPGVLGDDPFARKW
jgi:urease accessory protein